MASREVILEHPNRDNPASKATRIIVVALVAASAGLLAVITVGGWEVLLSGARGLQIAYFALYVLLAVLVARWRSGVLPLTAALAAILGIFAAISTPAWVARTGEGFTDPLLSSELLGTLTAVLLPVQVLLIVFALRGFSQQWQVEVERMPDGSTRSAQAWA